MEAARDPWQFLCEATSARIALGRCGGSVPTREWLQFSLAHARAQDAVHVAFDVTAIREPLQSHAIESLLLSSAATDRETYLRRPDLGRCLDDASREMLQSTQELCDLVVIISDGLSAPAAQSHSVAVATPLIELFRSENWSIAPVIIVRNGRVAIQDEIGQILGAKLSLVLLGERPGLGAPDSLGAYFVYDPRVGRTDAERNCVSNIRPDGLPFPFAIDTLHHLLTAARARRLSGVALKDERGLLSSTHNLESAG